MGYLPTIHGRLRQISETGAIQNVTFTTEEFKRSAEAYAAVFTIPEKTIINDQIDSFSELLRQLEQLGDDCVEHDVAETFWRLVDGDIKDADSNSLVSTTVGNYVSGGSRAGQQKYRGVCYILRKFLRGLKNQTSVLAKDGKRRRESLERCKS